MVINEVVRRVPVIELLDTPSSSSLLSVEDVESGDNTGRHDSKKSLGSPSKSNDKLASG